MQVPAFRRADPLILHSAYNRGGRCDHTTEAGARRAARMIEYAWHNVGVVLSVPVKEVRIGDGTIWTTDLRDILPNGLPANG